MSDSEIEVLEVHLDQDDVMDDLRDVLVQRRNEAVAPEGVVNFDLPSVLVEEVLPGKLGEKDQTQTQGQVKESRASRRKNRMTRSDRRRQARSRREKFNIPDRKAKPYSTKEGRAEGRKTPKRREKS